MDTKSSATGSMRTQSDHLVEIEIISAAMQSPDGVAGRENGFRNLSGKGGGLRASPGGGGSTSSRHTRKTRSAQMNFDADELGSCTALTRASSASMGFSFTAFTVPSDDNIADSRILSDNEGLYDFTSKLLLPHSIKLSFPILFIYHVISFESSSL